MLRFAIVVCVLLSAACHPTPAPQPAPTDPDPVDERKPVVPSSHELHARFEGTSFANDCRDDVACRTAGCGGEICSAAADVVSTCEVLPVALPDDAACACLSGLCQWYSPSNAVLRPSDAAADGAEAGADGEAADGGATEPSCATMSCEPPTKCIEYFGIAGPRGPKFASCEIPCGPKAAACPAGKSCVTIADGPGQVCR